ncbi:MAG: DUF3617 family protein [Candidatus Parcubacteria bacterium]|nr:DUF3617 family protein [Burkholderiales bacterium]
MRHVLFFILAAACVPAAGQTMEPGEWEFRTVTTSSMIPAPQTDTRVQCVSPEDARDPTRFTSRNEIAGCSITPGELSAGTFEWTVQCQQGLRGTGKAIIAGATIEGEMRMNVDLQGVKMEITAQTRGRRLGPCK